MDLRTERLILREFQDADFEDYLAYILDDDLREMLGLGNVFDRPSALAALCQHLRDAGSLDYLDGESLRSNLPSQRLLEKLGFQHFGVAEFDGIELATVVLLL